MQTELRWLVLAGVLLAVGAVAMLSMHEQHYRARRARLLEARVAALESLFTEDRRL